MAALGARDQARIFLPKGALILGLFVYHIDETLEAQERGFGCVESKGIGRWDGLGEKISRLRWAKG